MSDLLKELKRYHGKAEKAKSQNEAMTHESMFREFCWAAAPKIIKDLEELETRRKIEPWDKETADE